MTAPSPILQEALALGFLRAATDPLTGNATGIYGQVGGVPNQVIPLGGGMSALLATGKPLKYSLLGDSGIFNGGGRIATELQRLSSGRLVAANVVGISGAAIGSPGQLGQILVQMPANIDPTADIVILSGGSNDANSNGWVGGYYGGCAYFCQYVKSLGKIPVVISTMPRPTSGPALKLTNRYPFAGKLACDDNGGIFIDAYYDWRSTSGGYPPGYSDDATHPAASQYWLYRQAASRIWDGLNPYFAPGNRPSFMEVTADSDNAGYSGLDQTAGGTPYGNALFLNGSAGWANSTPGKVTITTPSATPFRGNKMLMDFTASGIAAADGTVTVSRGFLNTAAAVKPAIGALLQVRCVLECSNLINANALVTLKSPSNFTEFEVASNLGAANLTAAMNYVNQVWSANPNADTAVTVYLQQARSIILTCTGSGTNLTVSAVSAGGVPIGAMIAGTGVPAGTTIVSQTSGPTGGAGMYVTSAATTISAGAAEVLATGKVSISNCDLYNITAIKTTQFGYS